MSTISADTERRSDQQNNGTSSSRIWGDVISKTENETIIRIGFQNINGFGYRNNDKFKAEEIRETISDNKFDLFAMVEINANWKKVSKRNNIWSRTRGWFENQRTIAHHNLHDNKCKYYQPGGTAIIAQGDTALRQLDSGGDKRKLGRWSWYRIRGKNNKTVRVVSIYVPHTNKTQGKSNVYSQHQDALLTMGITKDPIEIFWGDMWEEVDKWIDEGDQIVLAGDWNTDVREADFRDKFLERGLVPAIIGTHGEDGPETYDRGNNPIDEIFISANIEIAACGYLAHGETLGDHRILWIDIKKHSALGTIFPNFPLSQARRLKNQDPRITKRYNDFLDNYLTKNGFYLRLQQLYLSHSTPLTRADEEEYEKLDRLRDRGMQQAERQCRKLHMGGRSWSPTLQAARDRIKYFRLSIARLKGRKVHANTLTRLSKKININTKDATLANQMEQLDSSYKIYKIIRQRHKELRQSFVEDLAERLEENGNGHKATIVRTLIDLETQRSMYRHIKRTLGNSQSLSTTHITITNENGTTRELTKQQEMEDAIIKENIKKYHQTENTCPFHHSPLIQDFGFYGEGPCTHDVYTGRYQVPSSVDEYTRSYIEICKRDQHTFEEGDAKLERSFQEFSQGWKKMKEKTSSHGPLHFGHFKAATNHPSIIASHYILAEIPFRTGYNPCRWKQATNVMILKKAGIFDITKLRTIVLYEADFNHNNKWLGKAMMQHTINNNQLAKEQYSIPGKKAIDHALNRRLLFDLIRYKKTSLAMTSCDLKSNYDRIAHVPALLAMRRVGIPIAPIQSMFKTIQNIQYTTRTAYGDSEKKFGGFDGNHIAPVQGEGQGNGSGPQVWAVVSSAMFSVMRKHGLETHFSTPITKQEIDICGFAFVDDTDIVAALENRNDPEATMCRMQEVVNGWEGVAKSTGGALAPDKSWFYLINFDWQDGKWSYSKMEQGEYGHISARDSTNVRRDLKYLDPSMAQEMLGVFLAPDGNNKKQIEEFKKKTVKIGEMIRSGHLDKNEAWTAMNTVAIKSIEYALPALTLTEKDCISVMWPLLKALLPKAGISRTIKRSVLYGTSERQGMGVKNIYHTQGNSHVISIIENLWKDSLTGFFIKSNLEQLRLEIGENGNVFEKKYTNYKPFLLTESWIQNTWEYCSKHHITLAENTANLNLRRHRDSCIMEKVRQYGTFSPADLKKFNSCRMYLRVFSLSDIAESNGHRISHEAWKGIRNPLTDRSYNTSWPIWENPSKLAWAQWRKILRRVFCPTRERCLARPLGAWKNEFSCGTSWQWFEDLSDDTILYQRIDNTWSRHERVGRYTRTRKYSCSGTAMIHYPKLQDVVAVTITSCNDGTIMSHSFNYPDYTPESPISIHIDTAYRAWLRCQTTSSASIEDLVQSIKDGSTKAASDGSYKSDVLHGTAGWTIETPSSHQYITGMSLSPGTVSDQSAYRSELVGLLAIMDRLWQLCEDYSITKGSVTIYCDSKSALHKAFWRKPTNLSPSEKHSDLISAIMGIHRKLPISIQACHIRAHQDEDKPYSSLSHEAQLNIRMDFVAKKALAQYAQCPTHTTNFPVHPMSLICPKVRGKRVFHQMLTDLYKNIATDKLEEDWMAMGRFTPYNSHLIHWPSQFKAYQAVSPARRRFISKWVSESIGTGKNMVRWNFRPHGKCPFCMRDDEDVHHILHCPHTNSIQEWAKRCRSLLTTLQLIDTDPYAILAIQRCLIRWRLGHDPSSLDDRYDTTLRKVLQDQHSLGWRCFCDGLIATSWIEYQQKYFRDTKSRRSVRLWASKLIQALWEFTAQVWGDRNSRLHDTEIIKDMEGKQKLEQAIRREWDTGLGNLPAAEFSYLLSGSLETILKRPIFSLRRWLAIVRNGRILLDTTHLITDEFMEDEALRRWIGIILPSDEDTDPLQDPEI